MADKKLLELMYTLNSQLKIDHRTTDKGQELDEVITSLENCESPDYKIASKSAIVTRSAVNIRKFDSISYYYERAQQQDENRKVNLSQVKFHIDEALNNSQKIIPVLIRSISVVLLIIIST